MKTINSNSIETEISINNFITTFNFIEQRNELDQLIYFLMSQNIKLMKVLL